MNERDRAISRYFQQPTSGTRDAILAAVLGVVPHAASVHLVEQVGHVTVKIRRKWWVRLATWCGVKRREWSQTTTLIIAREAAWNALALGMGLSVEVI